MRVLGLDHGEARCGCAVSDPTGTIATPLGVVTRPDTAAGLDRLARLVHEEQASLVVVGLPLTLGGEEKAQAQHARKFAERLGRALAVPVTLYDERLTTVLAERKDGAGTKRSHADSRAAAHLLESYLAARRAGVVPSPEDGPPARPDGQGVRPRG